MSASAGNGNSRACRWRFIPKPNDELVTASEWYERQKPGLGAAFSEEVFRALNVLEDAPET